MSRASSPRTPATDSPVRRARTARPSVKRGADRAGTPPASVARKPRREKLVYLFAEGNASMKDLLGGKGANLAEMSSLGLPVPPGFIVTTRACNAYLAAGGFPPGLWDDVQGALAKVERATGRKFGDPANPLLLSCRSGARFSMPGMMDTVLNLGLNDEVAQGLSAQRGGDRRFVFDAYRRLVQMFGTVVLELPDEPFEAVLARHRAAAGVANDADLPAAALEAITAEFKAIVKARTRRAFPADPLSQLRLAVEAVFRSWNGKRAIDYRNAAGHRARPRHRRQRADHGVRQPRRGLGHRRRDDAQRDHRRARDRGRLADQRAGRGRRRGNPRDAADRRARRRDAEDLARVRPPLPAARAPLPRRAGHRVHDRARQAAGCCRRATPSAPRRRRSGSPSTSPASG